MPLFTLWRTFAPDLNATELELVTVRMVTGATWFPDVLWHRSYGIDEPGRIEGFCVYEGPTEQIVGGLSSHCRVPYDAIREVQECRADDSGAGMDEVPDGISLFLVERELPASTSPDRLREMNLDSTSGSPEVSWLRSYWDPGRNISRCIFRATSREGLAAAMGGAAVQLRAMAPVQLNHPALWAELYDSIGLRRHWETAVAVG